MRSRTRQLTWTDEQHLTRGWLASRTPTQYVTTRAHASPAELTIAHSGPSECQVINRLGTAIHRLMLCNENGKLFSAAAIEQRMRADLKPLGRRR